MSEQQEGPRRRAIDARGYWRTNLLLIGSLLTVWAFVSLGCSVLWIDWLNQYRFPLGDQLPLGFWFAQQGSMYVFVLLIFIYAFAMDRLDRKYGVQQ